jgi:hypothetical protein
LDQRGKFKLLLKWSLDSSSVAMMRRLEQQNDIFSTAIACDANFGDRKQSQSYWEAVKLESLTQGTSYQLDGQHDEAAG